MKPPAVFLKKSHLFANASHRSDSSQYVIIIFQSLIRIFFLQGQVLIKSSHLELKHKRFLWFDLDLCGYVHKKRVKMMNKFYYLLYLVLTLIFYHIICIFLNLQLLVKMMNFVFIKVTWKLGYLRRLNFSQDKWVRKHTLCLHAKWLVSFKIWWQIFPK